MLKAATRRLFADMLPDFLVDLKKAGETGASDLLARGNMKGFISTLVRTLAAETTVRRETRP